MKLLRIVFCVYINHGLKVVAAAKEFKPNIIFLDYNIPDCNGIKCLNLLKADFKLQHVPVIMYSASAAGHFSNEAYRLGAARYMVKPVNYAGLFKGLHFGS